MALPKAEPSIMANTPHDSLDWGIASPVHSPTTPMSVIVWILIATMTRKKTRTNSGLTEKPKANGCGSTNHGALATVPKSIA